MNNKKINYSILLFMFVFTLILGNTSINISRLALDTKAENSLELAAEVPGEEQWVKNSDFSSQTYWYMDSEGDNSDVNGIISEGQANWKIIGEEWTFSNISGPPNASDWTPTKKPGDSIYPDVYEINQDGCEAKHEYWESSTLNIYGVMGNQTRNRPSVLWRRIIEMPHNMSDYSISAVDLSVLFNATANTNVETPNDNLTGASPSAAEFDHVTFYVQLSDMEQEDRYLAASYLPRDLGIGDLPASNDTPSDGIENYVYDTYLVPLPEDVLTYYLEKVLDYDDHNFTIFLGIDIDVEDNYAQSDRDTYYSLLFKSCNLTFDYQKKIDRFTTISWNQDCEKMSNVSTYPVLVQNATLNFKYKIDNLWNSSISPNSEIRILINDNKHTETVKLSTATTSFQDAKIGGFDVTNLITDDVNISLQVYLADDFILDQNITVSIDDVSLDISYIIVEPDEPVSPGPDLSWLVYTLTGAIIGIVIVISLYQGHFKYPPTVRKIRKLKKKVKKSKTMKPIIVDQREELIRNNFEDQKTILSSELLQHQNNEKLIIKKEEEK
ncbi:MAG: hypothetical protein ACFE9S_00040 [Candidatus Hermodarchaeota archaeon]